jgi:hypothetical protein
MLDATMEEKDVFSHWFQREEKGHAEQLFHTRVIVQERACALTIDHMALINAVSNELVEKLKLPMTPISQPYFLRLGDIKFAITHHTQVQFMLGKLSFTVWCDVLPLHTVSCHLFLGRSWCKDQGAAYHMDNYYYTKYVVPYDNKMYTLMSMDTMMYKAWREDRLKKKDVVEKIKEQEEAKKREAKAIVLLHAPVQSTTDIIALKTDSKPRTVSLKEGEDDEAASMYTPTNNAVAPRFVEEIDRPYN